MVLSKAAGCVDGEVSDEKPGHRGAEVWPRLRADSMLRGAGACYCVRARISSLWCSIMCVCISRLHACLPYDLCTRYWISPIAVPSVFASVPLCIVSSRARHVSPSSADDLQLEPEEAVALSTQMRGLTQKTVKLAGVRYRVYHHNPRSRLVGQVRAFVASCTSNLTSRMRAMPPVIIPA